ncbi:4'-phosphopantetheinyl transferase family protein [Shewanella psychrotolerans]|uniref:4'-phosphopantetheinyl transferase family protein n=1 Tax=Shewanella psychrotolerans TaxID=2864206 RepID=UPI001C65F3B2|nr:4'-phosphopantetheinyl transferase superfamily protein [Shewanella psychrotolerans]QYK02502.1 4'-phosphopantetheinyl transferase superfamily protein [Shewanella psychrotolerans]
MASSCVSHSLPVTLYFCPLIAQQLSEQQLQGLRSWLPVDEETKADRFLQPDARAKGLLVRSYLRGVLSLYAQGAEGNIHPNEWQFDYLEKGKPVLSEACFARYPLQFNISHSGDYLLVAITQSDRELQLGVDIERLRASTNIYAILNHYFTDDETLSLLALPEREQRARFFDLWALKESYIKAKGLGLALSLKSFSFTFNTLRTQNQQSNHAERIKMDGEPFAELNRHISLHLHDKKGKKQADEWKVVLGHMDDEYRFAVSVESKASLQIVANKVTVEQLVNKW